MFCYIWCFCLFGRGGQIDFEKDVVRVDKKLKLDAIDMKAYVI